MSRRLVTAAAVTSALLLAACGSTSLSDSGKSSPAAPEQTKVASLADKLPAKIKAAGKIVVGTDASYPPNEYFDADGKTIIGMDVDLFNAVAQKFGVKAEFVNANFDGLILNVQSGKYDVGVSSFSVNNERKKLVDFVGYYNAGTIWATAKGNPDKVDPDNACGLVIGVQTGTVQVQDLEKRKAKCIADGKAPIDIRQQKEQTRITTDLKSGRIKAMVADSPICTDAVIKAPDQLELLGKMYDAAPYGYAVPKGQDEFTTAIAQALTELKASGDYDKILAKWKSQDGAVSTFEVNPATSS